MTKIFWRIGLVAVVCGIGLGVWIIGCCKKPTDPPPPEPGEHLFYVAARLANNRSMVKTFSVERRAFIDSFTIDSFQIGNIAIAGNDEKLFMASRNEGVRVYDIKSKELLFATTEYCCGGRVSPNSEYYEAYSGGMRLFRTANYQEIYCDSARASFSNFSFDSKYCLYTRSDSIMVYNISGDSIEGSFGLTRNGSLFHVYEIWPTIDMKKLFLIGNQGPYLYFAVTDFGTDTVRVLQAPLRTWGEEAVVSPDGRYLYFVNTPYTDYEMPRMKIDVYDVKTEQLVTSISTREHSLFEPQYIALTSDGKYLMATPWSLGGCDVLLIDAQNFSVIGSYQFGYQIIPEEVCTKH
jgi:WD40 repeat protein